MYLVGSNVHALKCSQNCCCWNRNFSTVACRPKQRRGELTELSYQQTYNSIIERTHDWLTTAAEAMANAHLTLVLSYSCHIHVRKYVCTSMCTTCWYTCMCHEWAGRVNKQDQALGQCYWLHQKKNFLPSSGQQLCWCFTTYHDSGPLHTGLYSKAAQCISLEFSNIVNLSVVAHSTQL